MKQSALARAIEFVALKTAHLSTWLLVPMFCISLYEVIARYFFNAPTTWAAPIVSILFIAAVVPAGADLAARDGHVRMDAFYGRWSPAARALGDLLAAIALLIFAGVLAWKSAELAWKSVSILERSWGAFRSPVYLKKVAFAFGALLFLLEGCVLFIRGVARFRGRNP